MEKIPAGILVLIYLIGVGLLAVELFVPGMIAGSFGLLLIAFAVVAILTGKSVFWGMVLMAFTVVAGVFFLRYALRRFTLRQSLTRAEGYSSAREELQELLGREGVALTTLRPAGMADFNGDRVDVVTEGEMVSKDSRLKVILVEGNRIVVKPLDVSA